MNDPDNPLLQVLTWFHSQSDLEGRLGAAIRQSLDEVFDGQRTGRYTLGQLSKVEKTYIGTKVEILIQAEFGLERGSRMDYVVDGHEVDAKWSMKAGAWMIPREALGHVCLCLTADDAKSTFAAGLVRPTEERLRSGGNQDQKRQLNDVGIDAIHWLVPNGDLPENLLLNLSDAARETVMNTGISGQQRVNELFRQVQGRIIRREVVLTVAKQDDGPKRVRDARIHLAPEGILILGHQGQHPSIARDLGLPVPRKGSWVSCRVSAATSAAHATTFVQDQRLRTATEREAPAALSPRY